MARRLSVSVLVATVVVAWLALTAAPAVAACHVAAFVESDVSASAETGVTSLIVELQGRVGTCAGTVDVATVDGTAVAGQDYEAVAQTLTFEENDDRVETVDVTILADAEGGASFTLELSNPTGDISSTGGPATVTITGEGDGDAPAEDDADAPAEDDTSDQADDASTEGVELDDGEANDSEDDDSEDEGSLGIIIAVVVALVLGGGAFVVLRGRG